MSAKELESIIWTIADRFKFSPEAIWLMGLSELQFWYRGVCSLYEQEKEALDG
jgi:hypothetical protein